MYGNGSDAHEPIYPSLKKTTKKQDYTGSRHSLLSALFQLVFSSVLPLPLTCFPSFLFSQICANLASICLSPSSHCGALKSLRKQA